MLRALPLVCALPAAAQTPLDPAEVLDRFTGRTVTFVVVDPAGYQRPAGAVSGVEHFPEPGRSVYRPDGGECVRGTVTTVAGTICYAYDHDVTGAARHCWRPFEKGGRLLMRYDGPDGPTHEALIGVGATGCEGRPTS